MDIILAQCNFTVGDLRGNAEKMLRVVRDHGGARDLIVFSELACTGYPPGDLLLADGLVDLQDECLARIRDATYGIRAAVAVGHVSRNGGRGKGLVNSVSVLADGQVLHTYCKRALPSYDVFNEPRYFEPGTESPVCVIRGKSIGFLICEDAWTDMAGQYRVDAAEELLAGRKVDLVVSINASPSERGKQARRQRVFSAFCARFGVPLVYVNQVGGSDEIVFDGNSFAMDGRGELKLMLQPFAEDVAAVKFHAGTFEGGMCARALPTSAEFHYRHILMGLADYFSKCGRRKAVIGCSGGIDSAVTLTLAVDALGADNVVAITMPSKFSSKGSVEDSRTLCQRLGVELVTVPIHDLYETALREFERAFGTMPSRLARENLQARIRGQMLMAYSNHYGHLLLATGNRSELSVGYATLYGDMNGAINPIGDLYKTEIYALAEHLNQAHPQERIPRTIIEKAPSAELSEGQKDSDFLPPYDVLDAILRLHFEADLLEESEAAAGRLLLQDIDPRLVEHVLQLVAKAEFKRRQAPPIIRVREQAFCPGRTFPLAHRFPAHEWEPARSLRRARPG